MWKLGRKKSASETDERTFPAEKEFWLVRGAFREWQADRSGQGYIGIYPDDLNGLDTEQNPGNYRKIE